MAKRTREAPVRLRSYRLCGVVFKLASDGTETLLYSFTGGADGSGPVAPTPARSGQ